jgi:hypothetical protein
MSETFWIHQEQCFHLSATIVFPLIQLESKGPMQSYLHRIQSTWYTFMPSIGLLCEGLLVGHLHHAFYQLLFAEWCCTLWVIEHLLTCIYHMHHDPSHTCQMLVLQLNHTWV